MSTIDITIPREAMEAAAEAVRKAFCGDLGPKDAEWAALAACLAMLRNWPGMVVSESQPVGSGYIYEIILPLTENSNDKG